ncbi:MAG: hypothetical protein IT440_03940 [Phycisphaeraceae bacterium]|nr:hypothetical protein [Phycisphaeraceae bacterium]
MWAAQLCLVLCLGVTPVYADDSTVAMTVRPAVAPQQSSEAAWNSFVANALKALTRDDPVVGNPYADPGAFVLAGEIQVGQLVVTPFASWGGVCSDLPFHFRNERGSRLHFPLRIVGNGTRFRLNDLTVQITGTDANQCLNWNRDFIGQSYQNYRVGIDYGPDRQPDTADDIVYDRNQSGSLEIDELRYTGSGLGVECPERWPGNGHDNKLDSVVQTLMGGRSMFRITCVYCLNDPAGQELARVAANVQVMPRPKTLQIGPPPASPMPLLIGAGSGIFLIALFWGTRWAIRRYRYHSLAVIPYGEMPTKSSDH